MQRGHGRAPADAVAITGELKLDTVLSVRRHRMEVHEPDRFLVAPAPRAGDAGAGAGDGRAAPLPRAARHRTRGLRRHRAARAQDVLPDAECTDLDRVRVRD